MAQFPSSRHVLSLRGSGQQPEKKGAKFGEIGYLGKKGADVTSFEGTGMVLPVFSS